MTNYRMAVSALILFAAIALQPSCGGGGAASETSSSASATSNLAAQFRLASLDGGEVGPADYSDRVVLIEFWATWCGPCHVQAAILREIYADFDDGRAQFLAVSVGEPEEVVRSFVEDSPFPYPVLFDPEDQISSQLGINALPTVLVLDRNREIVYFSPGVADAETVRHALEEAGA